MLQQQLLTNFCLNFSCSIQKLKLIIRPIIRKTCPFHTVFIEYLDAKNSMISMKQRAAGIELTLESNHKWNYQAQSALTAVLSIIFSNLTKRTN